MPGPSQKTSGWFGTQSHSLSTWFLKSTGNPDTGDTEGGGALWTGDELGTDELCSAVRRDLQRELRPSLAEWPPASPVIPRAPFSLDVKRGDVLALPPQKSLGGIRVWSRKVGHRLATAVKASSRVSSSASETSPRPRCPESARDDHCQPVPLSWWSVQPSVSKHLMSSGKAPGPVQGQ